MPDVPNIFDDIPEQFQEELFQSILATDNIKIERIISKGHASPDGFWYDSDDNEWVILLKGSACLCFKKNNEKIVLKPGDHLIIPAHTVHRVEWTDSKQETIWLAVHY